MRKNTGEPAARLHRALEQWNSTGFARTLKHELERFDADSLPLAGGVSQGGHVHGSSITATILCFWEHEGYVEAKVGIFFTEIVAGCSCGDGPVLVDNYRPMRVRIDKETAEVEFELLPD